MSEGHSGIRDKKGMIRVSPQLMTKANTANSVRTTRSVPVGLPYVTGLSEHQ